MGLQGDEAGQEEGQCLEEEEVTTDSDVVLVRQRSHLLLLNSLFIDRVNTFFFSFFWKQTPHHLGYRKRANTCSHRLRHNLQRGFLDSNCRTGYDKSSSLVAHHEMPGRTEQHPLPCVMRIEGPSQKQWQPGHTVWNDHSMVVLTEKAQQPTLLHQSSATILEKLSSELRCCTDL